MASARCCLDHIIPEYVLLRTRICEHLVAQTKIIQSTSYTKFEVCVLSYEVELRVLYIISSSIDTHSKCNYNASYFRMYVPSTCISQRGQAGR